MTPGTARAPRASAHVPRLHSLRARALVSLALGIAVLAALGFFEISDEASLSAAEARLAALAGVQAANQSLDNGLRVQQSGLRVYTNALALGQGNLRGLGGPEDLLAEYLQGSAQATQATGSLERATAQTGDPELRSQLARVRAAADAWQAWAQAARAGAERNRGQVDAQSAAQGTALFDAFTNADLAFANRTEEAAQAGSADLDQRNVRHRRVFYAGLVIEALVLILFAAATIGSALRPIAKLTRTAERLAQGRFPPIPFVAKTDEVGSLARALSAWRLSAENMANVFERSPIGICRISPEGRILDANPALARMLGYPRDELRQAAYDQLTHPDHRGPTQTLYDELLRAQSDRFSVEKRYLRRDGTAFWGNLTVAAAYNEQQGVEYFVAMIEDVDVRKRQELELRHRAAHDSLTGLPNRSLFEDRLAQAVKFAKRHRSQLAVLLLDLDRFKPVNDELGHAAGDELLRQLARRLSSSLRASDTVARLGGDEFAVLLNQDGEEGASAAVEKLTAALEPPFHVDGETRLIGISIGFAVYPADARDAAGLLRHADQAMYRAKRAAGRQPELAKVSSSAFSETAE